MTNPADYGVTVWRCDRDHASFPQPLICPRCGSTEFHPVEATHGRIEEVTTAPSTGVRLASVRTEEDLVLVARADEAMARGDWVPLSRCDGVSGALYLPDSDHA